MIRCGGERGSWRSTRRSRQARQGCPSGFTAACLSEAGAVAYGDSLEMTKRRAWTTRGTRLGGEVAEVDPEDLTWPETALDESAIDDVADSGSA